MAERFKTVGSNECQHDCEIMFRDDLKVSCCVSTFVNLTLTIRQHKQKRSTNSKLRVELCAQIFHTVSNTQVKSEGTRSRQCQAVWALLHSQALISHAVLFDS